jgi:hypothetical protein
MRARAWDAEQDRQHAARLAREREEASQRHAHGARRLMEKALERLFTLVAMFDATARVERRALGQIDGSQVT